MLMCSIRPVICTAQLCVVHIVPPILPCKLWLVYKLPPVLFMFYKHVMPFRVTCLLWVPFAGDAGLLEGLARLLLDKQALA